MSDAPFHRAHWALVALLLLLCGCLPSSCSRTESRAITAADSLSRALALATPEDTLAVRWTIGEETLPGLSYPRTVGFAPGGSLYVSDAQSNRIYVISPDGRLLETVEAAFDAPYLAGVRGDTAVVFSPTPARFDLIAGGRVVRQVSVPGLPDDRSLLRYGSTWKEGFAFKGASDDTQAFVMLLDASGQFVERIELRGSFWQYAGLLREGREELYSLSFYRPVLYRLYPETTDSTKYTVTPMLGFDSPMLARTRLFLQGEEHEPPLLTPASAFTDTLTFALNMRPGWVQIDAFDTGGRLVRRLIQPDPGVERNFFPIHLDARVRDGGYDLAVAVPKPIAHVTMYRWKP